MPCFAVSEGLIRRLFYNQNKALRTVENSRLRVRTCQFLLFWYGFASSAYLALSETNICRFSFRELIEELHPIIKEALERRPEVSCYADSHHWIFVQCTLSWCTLSRIP